MIAGWLDRPAAAHPAGTIHYRVDGVADAPVVTMLHSLATDLRLWDDQAAILATDHYVLRVDLRGHGQSTGGGDDFDIALLADDIVALWDHLGIARSAVVGLSLGGMIALHLGLHQPDRVVALLAADCRSDAPAPFVALWDERRHLLAQDGMAALVAATLPTWFTPATLESGGDRVDRVARMIAATSTDGYVGATRALQKLALREALPMLCVPTLYVVGSGDGVHPVAMRDMADATPGAALLVIADASHLTNLEQPVAFNQGMLSFLAAHLMEDAA